MDGERDRERGGRNRGQARGQLPENARLGRVYDDARERGGDYGEVGEGDERGPLPIDRGRGGGCMRSCSWQGGPTNRGRGGRRAATPTGRAHPVERAGRGERRALRGPDGSKGREGRGLGLLCLFFYFLNF
jgi:hypothetical protein